MELAQYLKELRKKRRYTQEYVAYKLNICRQTYSHYETGRISPSAEMLSQIAELYKIPVERLFDVSINSHEDTKDLEKSQRADVLPLIEFLEDTRNYERLKSLDMAERQLIYYYENLRMSEQVALMAMVKVFFDHCVNKGMNNNNGVW